MPQIRLLSHALREGLPRARLPRVVEPFPVVTSDAAQLARYARAWQEDGAIAQIYLLHTVQLCELIAPGDEVLDLLGLPHQLAQVARLNPQAHFCALDIARRLPEDAEGFFCAQRLGNVRVLPKGLAYLREIPAASVDVVMSTYALHHLPDQAAVASCFAEIRRVLKPGGRLYLTDFGRLRRPATVHFMAQRFAEIQGNLFTADYFHSMRAAFSVAELRSHLPVLRHGARMYVPILAPFTVIIRSPSCRRLPDAARAELTAIRRRLPAVQQRDLAEMYTAFRMKGLHIPYFDKT